MAAVVTVPGVIDGRRIGGFQYTVFLLCAATLFVEGMDMQSIAYVAPALGAAWHLPRGALGPVFAAGLFGLMIGSFLIAPLADRIGRRRLIVWSTLAFGALTLLTALSRTPSSLLVMRLLAGLGFGGTMANAVALAAEYSPTSRRAGIVMTVFAGFPIGSAVGGFAAARLIPLAGWPAVFLLGGVLTLLLWLGLAAALPESVRFLALAGGRQADLAGLLSRIDPTFDRAASIARLPDENAARRSAPRHLFRAGRAAVTPLLWVVYFMSLLDLYLLASWLPTLIHARGIALDLAVIATALLQVGGIAGALVLGFLSQRLGAWRVVPVAYVLAALAIASIAFVGASVVLTMIVVFLAGFLVIGCQNCNNGLAAILYPTALRATGIGWANAVGRAGSIVGPSIAGIMLAMNADIADIFLLGALPALCAAAAAAAIARLRAAPGFGAQWAASAHATD